MERILFNCMDYAKHFSASSPNLIMMGSTGLGKTHLSLAIARAVIEKGFGVVYGSVNNLIDKLEREHFGREEEGSTRQSLMECDLLILDDLGTEFRTAFSSAELYNLVNTRQMTHRPHHHQHKPDHAGAGICLFEPLYLAHHRRLRALPLHR